MNKLLNINTKDRKDGSPFNAFMTFNTPINNIKHLKLLSVEMPLCWYNVRAGMNTLQYSIYDSFGVLVNTYTITVQEGNYTAMLFCSSLQTTMNSQISGTQATITHSDITRKISISLTNNYEIEIHEMTLTKYIIGFDDNQKGTTITANRIYNFNHDLYVSVVCSNMQSAYSNHFMTFKIPITNNMTTIQTLQVNEWFEQVIHFEQFTTLMNFNIAVYDMYDNLLDNNGSNWSLTFEYNT